MVFMLTFLKLSIFLSAIFGLAFALVLLLDWLFGKIDAHITREKKDRS